MNNNESLFMTIIDIVFGLLLIILLVLFGIAVYEDQPTYEQLVFNNCKKSFAK
jgi:uncharacterized membrane protein YqiK